MCIIFQFPLVFYLVTASSYVSAGWNHSESELLSTLFDQNYDPRARPPFDPNQAVNIKFRLGLTQIYEVDERAQTVSILSETYQKWRDPRLRWNLPDYNGIESFSVFYTTIWTPDTTLYNTGDMYRQNVEDRANARIICDENCTNDGALIYLIYNTHFTIGCRFNMVYFPFDVQNCTFELGSWTYHENQVHFILEYDQATTDLYKESQEWDLISFEMESTSVKYLCCKEHYQTIYAHLVIKRKSLFYVFNLVLPTILINIIGSFALFASPGNEQNRHDKLQIGITTLLSYCILLLSVSDQIPHGSTSIPLISWFFFGVMLQNALKIYVSMYLSYPNRRRCVMKILNNLKGKIIRIMGIFVKRIGVKDTGTQGKMEENEKDMLPELVCLWISITGLVIIIVAMFAVAY